MKIGSLDWNKLEPLGATKRKSFEELAYQLAQSKFSNEINNGAKLYSINDSGGGDGIEFYIESANGDMWGWQAKYFDTNSLGNAQIQQIKKSLNRAYEKHGKKLKRWYLCTKFNLTDPKWIKNELPLLKIKDKTILPSDHKVELISWGESKLTSLLSKNIDIYNFFFSDFLFSTKWFSKHKNEVMNDPRVSRKYIKELHIDSDDSHKIAQVLGGKKFEQIFDELVENNQIKASLLEYQECWERLYKEDLEDYADFLNSFRSIWKSKREWLDELYLKIVELKDIVVSKQHYTHSYRKKYKDLGVDIQAAQDEFFKIDEEQDKIVSTRLTDIKYDKSYDISSLSKEEINKENERREKARDILFGPSSAFNSYAFSSLQYIFRHFQTTISNELHIRGNAGYGKSHLCVSAFDEQSTENLPALFLHAEDVSSFEDIPKKFNCPNEWNIENLLSVLSVAGKVNKSKAIIVIDGLSETKKCKSVWKNQLPQLIKIIQADYANITLITSFRTSYQDELFYKDHFEIVDYSNICFLFGFNELTNEAIKIYFTFYNIELQNPTGQLDIFDHPLYLRIYCETKNPNRKMKVIVERVSKSDIFRVFDAYIEQANERIMERLNKKNRYNHDYSRKKIFSLANNIWKSGSRSIDYSKVQDIITQDELEYFEGEDLLLYLDKENGVETLSFAYDLMAGYIIAQSLLSNLHSNEQIADFIRGEDFANKLLSTNVHSLHDDILRCLVVLLLKDYNILLSDVLDDKKVNSYCVSAVFEIEKQFIIKNNDVHNLINSYIDSATIPQIWNVINLSHTSMLDEGHPFNARFWDKKFRNWPMAYRDIVWSEYVRKADNGYSANLVDSLYRHYRLNKITSSRSSIGAIYASWILTSTNRKLRDEATRALYWTGRRDPNLLYSLMKSSVRIDDVYIFERISAALYGVVMAAYGERHATWSKEFVATLLPDILRHIYDSTFSKEQTYNVEHYLLRDNLLGILKVGNILCPHILNKVEMKSLDYPIEEYKHKTWGIYSKSKNDDPIGHPLHMDFENYTLGGLVSNRGNYDYKHKDYRDVVSKIHWRIFDLGYRVDLFGDIDREIINIPFRNRVNNDGKIDRYGKKYSWIAYFELYSLLLDTGKLMGYNGSIDIERDSDVDIDPSFPEPLKVIKYTDEIFSCDLINVDVNNRDWIETPLVEFNKSIQLHRPILDGKHSWVPLFSRVEQKNLLNNWNRDVYVNLSTALIDDDELKKMAIFLEKNKEIDHRLFENISNTYLYAGEVPWSAQMNKPEPDTTFNISNKNHSNEADIYYAPLKPLVYETHWESYHSLITPNADTISPNRDFCNFFRLSMIPQSSNTVDARGTLISQTFITKNQSLNSINKHLYVRKDKLDKYLKNKKLNMVWVVWSEKRFFEEGIGSVMKKGVERDYREYCTISIYNHT